MATVFENYPSEKDLLKERARIDKELSKIHDRKALAKEKKFEKQIQLRVGKCYRAQNDNGSRIEYRRVLNKAFNNHNVYTFSFYVSRDPHDMGIILGIEVYPCSIVSRDRLFNTNYFDPIPHQQFQEAWQALMDQYEYWEGVVGAKQILGTSQDGRVVKTK